MLKQTDAKVKRAGEALVFWFFPEAYEAVFFRVPQDGPFNFKPPAFGQVDPFVIRLRL